jgi:hypothetical protein
MPATPDYNHNRSGKSQGGGGFQFPNRGFPAHSAVRAFGQMFQTPAAPTTPTQPGGVW